MVSRQLRAQPSIVDACLDGVGPNYGGGQVILSELRAQAWKYATLALSALAVVLLIVGLLFWVRGTHAVTRADAAEQRAQASEARAKALSDALERDSVADNATSVARHATDNWQAENAARAARVKGYADSAGDACVADADLVRELQEGATRVAAAEDRLRNLRPAEGKPAK